MDDKKTTAQEMEAQEQWENKQERIANEIFKIFKREGLNMVQCDVVLSVTKEHLQSVVVS